MKSRLQILSVVAEEVNGELDMLAEALKTRSSAVRELCLGVALVLPRRLYAVSALVDSGLGTEADAITRGLIETALNLSWVGDSDERARRIQLAGPRELLRLYENAKKAGFSVLDETLSDLREQIDLLEAGADLKCPPKIFERAKDSALLPASEAKDAYVMAFARESSVVHHDWLYICRVKDEIDMTGDMLHDTLAATLFILGAITSAFHSSRLEEAARQVQRAVKESAGM